MVFLFLFGKHDPARDIDIDIDIDKRHLRIRCPRCQWQPGRHDLWVCNPGCGHWWNTFDTHGLCPACQKQWLETECRRCSIMSPHDDWYATN